MKIWTSKDVGAEYRIVTDGLHFRINRWVKCRFLWRCWHEWQECGKWLNDGEGGVYWRSFECDKFHDALDEVSRLIRRELARRNGWRVVWGMENYLTLQGGDNAD